MLELSKLLVLVRNPLLYSYDNNLMWKRKRKDSKRESKKWVPHRDPVECSGLLTRLRLTHYGYRLTVLRNEVSDTDCSSLNWSDRKHSLVWAVNDISLLANSLWPPARRAEDGGAKFSKFCVTWFMNGPLLILFVIINRVIKCLRRENSFCWRIKLKTKSISLLFKF